MENIVLVSVGILLVVLGCLISFNNKINLIHSYHYKRVKKEDIPYFCKGVGNGNIIVGAGLLLFPPVNLLASQITSLIITGSTVVFGLTVSLGTIIKYNKGLF
ncbi:MAG: hypothetical protein Q4F95_09610 [Oscillospiraceae bacterium]|nr:hypothetical protein [Oscillospiraceae bacterium]